MISLKNEYLHNQVKNIKNIYIDQSNLLLASEISSVLNENPYQNSNEIIFKKCAYEKIYTNNKDKYIANLVYKNRYNIDLVKRGLIKHQNIPFLGDFIDGITQHGTIINFKCLKKKQYISNKLNNLSFYRWSKIQCQLEICELDICDLIECVFEEYKSENEYLSDSSKNERGAIFEYNGVIKYSPLYISGEDLYNWKKNLIEQYPNNLLSNFSYWTVKEMSCKTIYRNQEWFHKIKDKLEIFWNKVLLYKNCDMNNLKNDIQLEIDNLKNKRNNTIFMDIKNELEITKLEEIIIDTESLQPNKKRKIS